MPRRKRKPSPAKPLPQEPQAVPHLPEPEHGQPPPAFSAAPHMAEKESVVEAQIVTMDSPEGKTTIMVEREPGKATHATVIDEKPTDEDEPDAPSSEQERRRKRRAERRTSRRSAPRSSGRGAVI